MAPVSNEIANGVLRDEVNQIYRGVLYFQMQYYFTVYV